MKRVLVTGGAGFIGSHLVDELLRRGYEVRILDNLDPQVHPEGEAPDYMNPDAEFIHGDVRDGDAFYKALNGMDAVLHQASVVGIGQSQYQIARYVSSNIQGTANLLDILVNKRHKVRKLIVAASMSSYGEGLFRCDEHGDVRPYTRSEEQLAGSDWELHCPECGGYPTPQATCEDAKPNINSIYAITKKTQEDMCLMTGRIYNIPTVALRYFNVYGPRQSLSNPYTGVAAIFLSRIKNGKRPIVYEDGNQSRDFVSIHDVVQSNMLALEKSEGDYNVFNVGAGVPVKIVDIARTIAELFGSEIKPEISNSYRKGDIRHCYADINRISRVLGYERQVPFDEGMRELMEWARDVESVDRFDEAARELADKGLA